MKLHCVAALLILMASICLAGEPAAQKPIKIAAYDLSGKHSLEIISTTGESLELPTFSGALIGWHDVVVPIKIKTGENGEHFKTWAPDSEATSRKWVLITYQDSKTKEHKVRAIPAENLMRDQDTLYLINLTSMELKSLNKKDDLRLKPHGQAFLEVTRPSISVELKASESPHYSQVSLSQLDANQSFLLILAYPYIQGSAQLSHRLVRLQNFK